MNTLNLEKINIDYEEDGTEFEFMTSVIIPFDRIHYVETDPDSEHRAHIYLKDNDGEYIHVNHRLNFIHGLLS